MESTVRRVLLDFTDLQRYVTNTPPLNSQGLKKQSNKIFPFFTCPGEAWGRQPLHLLLMWPAGFCQPIMCRRFKSGYIKYERLFFTLSVFKCWIQMFTFWTPIWDLTWLQLFSCNLTIRVWDCWQPVKEPADKNMGMHFDVLHLILLKQPDISITLFPITRLF